MLYLWYNVLYISINIEVMTVLTKSTFQLQLPEELLPFLDKINGDSINQKVRVAFAINLFAQKTVSLAKAAELSGQTLVDFMDILKDQGYPWGEYQEKNTCAKMIG